MITRKVQIDNIYYYPGSCNNLVNMLKSNGYRTRKETHTRAVLTGVTEYWWSVVVVWRKVHWHTHTDVYPAGSFKVYSYIYPKDKINKKTIVTEVTAGSGFYDDGLDEKLGGEAVGLGG